MTPAQKTALDARQSIDRIEHLVQWLDRHRQVVGESQPGLVAALKMLSVRYRGIQQAVDRPPAIALVSEWTGLRAQMVGALTSPQTPPSESELKQNEAEILRRLLLRQANVERAVAVRYRAGETSAPPRDHPFPIALLGIADLAAIMVGVHQICFPGGTPTHETLARMSDIHRDVATKVQTATMSGLTEADVAWLQETVERSHPGAPGLRLLAAASYWRDLADVAAHIPDSERVRALSLLWNDEPDLTKIFADLVAALSQLGFTTEAFVTREALLERDPASGWFVPHPDSILAATTLQQVASRNNNQTVRVVGRYGHPATMPRAVIAAITAEVGVAVPAGAMATLAAADVIDVPAIDLPCDLEIAALRRSRRPHPASDAGPSLQQMLRVFAHVKTRYLLERASRRHEVTCMVACVESGSPASGLLPGAIGDWVELAHGSEAHQRQRARTRLFVVAEAIEAAASAETVAARVPDVVSEALSQHVSQAIAAGLPWLDEWTPGEPFANTFTVRLDHSDKTDRTSAARRSALLSPSQLPAESTSELARRTHAQRLRPLPLTPIATRGDAQRLLDAVASVSGQSSKEQELRGHLADLHARARSRLLRYRADGDTAELDDWRRRVAAVLDHRLRRLARRKQLGLLLSALRIEEPQLIAIYRRSAFAALDERTKGVTRSLQQIDFDEPEGPRSHGAPVPRAMSVALAQAAVGHWLESMRQLVRAERLCRQIGMPVWAAEHLIDEIGFGAARLGLVRRTAEVIETFVARTHAGERAFAGAVAAVLHGFLERLDLDDPRTGRTGTALGGADVVIEHAAPHAASEELDDTSAPPPGRPFAEHWCDAFSRLVEANISGAHYWSAGEANTDLARLLSEFPNIRLEVEP